jgi:hypothetical protein
VPQGGNAQKRRRLAFEDNPVEVVHDVSICGGVKAIVEAGTGWARRWKLDITEL